MDGCVHARALQYFTWTFVQKRTAHYHIALRYLHAHTSTKFLVCHRYNVLFLSTIKSNAKHLTSRTVHLVHWFCPRAHIHRGNHCFLSEYFDENNKDNFSIVSNFKKFLNYCD